MLSDDRVEESLVDLDECLEHADDGDSLGARLEPSSWVRNVHERWENTRTLGDFWTLDEHILP